MASQLGGLVYSHLSVVAKYIGISVGWPSIFASQWSWPSILASQWGGLVYWHLSGVALYIGIPVGWPSILASQWGSL